jgi:DNA polymerase III delta prime subunit
MLMSSELSQLKKSDTATEKASPNDDILAQSSPEYMPSGQRENGVDPTNLKASSSEGTLEPSQPDAEALEVDPNQDRRKRRKTASPKSKISLGCDQEHTPLQRSNPPDFQKGVVRPTNRTMAPTSLAAEELRGEPLGTSNRLSSTSGPPAVAEEYKGLENDIKHQLMIAPTSAATKGMKHVIVLGEETTIPKESSFVTLVSGDEDGSKPKKILRLNPKTGTIGSPPAKKKEANPIVAQRAGRPSRPKQPASKLVTIHYGQDSALSSEVGQKIGQILDGTATAASFASNSPPKREPIIRKVAGANPGATPHPFFLGKATVKASDLKEPSSSTPENKATQRPKESSIAYLTGPKFPKKSITKAPATAFATLSGFGAKTAKMPKYPGAVEPAWPWKGMIHIRGTNAQPGDSQLPRNFLTTVTSMTRKSKHQAVEVLADEDVIDTLATDLCIPRILQSIREINLDEYPALPGCLRVPSRHITTGPHLQKAVQKELSVPFTPSIANKEDSASDDELQATSPKRKQVHPALTSLYNTLATSLSAFDQSRCEIQSWTQKHSPKVAAEVLQTGREAMILKEWLQTLTVQSFETGTGDRSHSRASSVSRRPAVSNKRKQKSKKLEGFVVSSDEDDADMDEISEPESDVTPHGAQGAKRTVIRTSNADAKGSGRLTNAVVISGPHGSGKTAAVYAVAKELGFEIFEINAGSRRSGKDILERVGDMTHNHLVQSTRQEVPADSVDVDAQRIADALESDIKSGRQGTMNSFFKPRESTKPKTKPKKQEHTTSKSDSSSARTASKANIKQQKQSLVLFEEADVLYEEDKQFWATVMAMISQSKRPIIITCTDESAIPLESLALHAIIRFMPPPVDLAVDYMLLVAANEGHLIRRDAVTSLYESRGLDLRASLMELNFWCQFAVGDIKGGLEWLYIRWPPGSDVDEEGHTIRLISEGTYETGMGWLSHDFLESSLPYLAIEEETLHEAWDGWRLDIGDYDRGLDIATSATKMKSQTPGRHSDAAAVSVYGDYLDAMSATDIYAGGLFAPDSKVNLPPFPITPYHI